MHKGSWPYCFAFLFLFILSGCERKAEAVHSEAPTTVDVQGESRNLKLGIVPSRANSNDSSSPAISLKNSIVEAREEGIQLPDKLLKPYVDARLIGAEPDLAEDYNQFYLVRSHSSFLGYRLLAFETADMREAGWIGCCINPGLSMLILTQDDDTAAAKFAASNQCRLLGSDDFQMDYFGELQIPDFDEIRPKLRIISCHDYDRSDP